MNYIVFKQHTAKAKRTSTYRLQQFISIACHRSFVEIQLNCCVFDGKQQQHHGHSRALFYTTRNFALYIFSSLQTILFLYFTLYIVHFPFDVRESRENSPKEKATKTNHLTIREKRVCVCDFIAVLWRV